MRTLTFIILTNLGLGAWSSLSEAQSQGGYDQFGEYVEEFVVDDEVMREREQKRLEEKLASYLEKIKKNSKDSLTNFLLGNLYVQMNRNQDAIPAYQTALKLNPGNGETHYHLAKAYDAVRDGPNAFKHAKQAQKIFKRNLYIHWQVRSRQLLRQLQKQYGVK